MKTPSGASRAPEGVALAEAVAESVLCSPARGLAGFVRFCRKWMSVYDPSRKVWCPLELWPGQLRVAKLLVAGRWLILLKGRRVGLTTLVGAFTLWRLVYDQDYLAAVIFQELKYAKDFKRRVEQQWRRLPLFIRPNPTTNHTTLLQFASPPKDTSLHAMVGSERAARSFTGHLYVVDEASRVDNLADTLAAVEPSLVKGGQVILLTTSAGPSGDLYEIWQATYGRRGELLDADGQGPTGFTPVFIHWSERPDRSVWNEDKQRHEPDRAFYKAEKARLDRISPVAIKQEYPDNIQEAWEHAAGRVYPLFNPEMHVGELDLAKMQPGQVYVGGDFSGMERFRAIDWGETRSAYVCLWVVHIPGPPSLLIHPSCENTIREFLSYRLEEDPPYRPMKENDHTCDALRYLVTTRKLKGLVYVYREVYRTELIEKGYTIDRLVDEIHTLSGWKRSVRSGETRYRPSRDAEEFVTTVCDRAQGLAIATLCSKQIPARPAAKIKKPRHFDAGSHWDNPYFEILEGVFQVAALIDGTQDLDQRVEVTREREIIREYEKIAHSKVKAGVDLETRRMLHLAEAILRANEERQK